MPDPRPARDSSGVIQCSRHADAGKLDATAKGMALGLTMFQCLDWVRALPATAGWLEEESTIARKLCRLAGGAEAALSRLLWLPGLCALFFRLGERHSQGAAAHVLCRKLWFQELVSRALSGGCRQVVALGAGLDPRCLRLCRLYPETLFVELDLPAAMRVKARYLRATRDNQPENLRLLGQDLTSDQPLAPITRLPAFDVASPTLVLAEGLLMYLPQDRAQALLGHLRGCIEGPLTVGFTCLDADPARDQGIRTVVRALRRRRLPPFCWRIDATDVAGWLRGCGLTPQEVVDGDALQTVSLPADRRGPGFGELMVLAN